MKGFDKVEYSIEKAWENVPENTICTRYVSLEKFLDLLIHKRIAITSLASQEDKNEGQFSDNFLRNKIIEVLDEASGQNFIPKPNYACMMKRLNECGMIDLQKFRHLFYKPIRFYVHSSANYLLDDGADQYKTLFDRDRLLEPFRRITEFTENSFCHCFTKSDTENYLLWKSYTENGKGICYSFDLKKLLRAVFDHKNEMTGFKSVENIYSENIRLYAGDVLYDHKKSHAAQSFEEALFRKKNQFEDEKEYRIAFHNENFYGAFSGAYLNIENPLFFMRGIVVSPFVKAWEKDVYKEVICSNSERDTIEGLLHDSLIRV